jgi:hypothetical protein
MRDRFLLAVLLRRGITIPEEWSAPVLAALIGLGAGVWAAGTHWLQTRAGKGWWPRLARFVGRVLVLGPAALPQYTDPPR